MSKTYFIKLALQTIYPKTTWTRSLQLKRAMQSSIFLVIDGYACNLGLFISRGNGHVEALRSIGFA